MRFRSLALMVLLPLAGCGGGGVYYTSGVLVDKEGNPVTELEGGSVEMEPVQGKSSSRGNIKGDGTFVMSTEKYEDGALPGKNRVLIMRPYKGPDTPMPRVILAKYDKFETSEIEVTIEPKKNELKIEVERIRKLK